MMYKAQEQLKVDGYRNSLWEYMGKWVNLRHEQVKMKAVEEAYAWESDPQSRGSWKES